MFKREETRRLENPKERKVNNGPKVKLFFSSGLIDKPFVITILLLVVFGLVILFSASLVTAHSNTGDAYYYIKKQLFGLSLGLISFFVLAKIDYHFLKKYSLFFLFLAISLLILVFVPGVRANFGTSYSWIVIFGQSFQVAEAVKLLLIFYLSAWVEIRQDDLKQFSTGLLPFMSVVSLIGILLIAQPDLGTFILVFSIALSIYFVAEGNMKQLIILFLIFVFSSLIFLSNLNNPDSDGLMRSYQINRIRCLQNPEFDRDICYQVNQSLIAVGSGGLWGRGFGNSIQKFNYLPEVWADSIFPVIAEEIGFIGSLLLLLVYIFIFYKGMMIAKRAPDMYGRSMAVGISVWIFFQAFLNIGGMINLIPMTGVPLPFVSAGGTSLWFLLASCGILVSIGRQKIEKNK
ncbi:MAG TPA: putative peptidoglycan glycosyltransferase FtsW [bacterium]|nr:putative peptidoglycan glycosyltransferase FtsW [bacterium]